MNLDANTLMVLVVILSILVLFLLIFIYFGQKNIDKSLHVIDENQKNIAKNQLEITQKNQNSNTHFWYEKLSSLDEKQAKLSQSIYEQLTKNIELFSSLKTNQTKMQKDIQTTLFKELENVSEKVDKRLRYINEKVEDRLKTGFESIDVTFKEIIKSIANINQAQKNIESLSTKVSSLQEVLTDKKTRGVFGEVQLESILDSIFGEKQQLYSLQHKLSNGNIVDASIKAPAPMGLVCIDSKFPLENFRHINEDSRYENAFYQDMKNHINAISEKYILPNETADIAILFLPAEAIFAHINAYNENIIDYARTKSVWIASPTTLMALLSTVLAVLRDIKTRQQARKIQEELARLSQNFKLYKTRWENLSRHIDTVHKDVKEITTTTAKISNEFDRIENVELDEKDMLS